MVTGETRKRHISMIHASGGHCVDIHLRQLTKVNMRVGDDPRFRDQNETAIRHSQEDQNAEYLYSINSFPQ